MVELLAANMADTSVKVSGATAVEQDLAFP